MAPKLPKAERLRALRSWVLEHAGTLRLREGSSLRERVHRHGNLVGERSWHDFLRPNRSSFTAAEEAHLRATFHLLVGELQPTPTKRQRTEDATPCRLQVSPTGQAMTPARTPAHLRTPLVAHLDPDAPEDLVLSPAAALALAQCRRGTLPELPASPSVGKCSRPEEQPCLDKPSDIQAPVPRFVSDMREYQRLAASSDQLPNKRGKDSALYYRLRNMRVLFQGARRCSKQSPLLQAEEARQLATIPGFLSFCSHGLGGVQRHAAGWGWTFEPAGYDVHSDSFETQEEAWAEFLLLLSKLYPGWEQEGGRLQHLQRLLAFVRQLREQAPTLGAPAMQAFHGSATVALEDFRLSGDRLRNAFPGFRNLGNTCFLNACLQCLFHCRPFCEHLLAEDPCSSVMGSCVRGVLHEYLRTEGMVLDVLTPALVVKQVVQQCGYVAGRQQDPAETLHGIFGSLDQGAMHVRLCCTGAEAALTGILMCQASDHAEAGGYF